MPQRRVYVPITVPQKKKDRIGCGNDRGNSLVSQAGKVLLKVIAVHLSGYRERENILPDKQCKFRPQRSTVELMFVVRRLQKMARKEDTLLYLCFIDHTKEYDCVDRNFLSDVPARSGAPPRVLAVICDFHAGMKTCFGSDDGEYSDTFDV